MKRAIATAALLVLLVAVATLSTSSADGQVIKPIAKWQYLTRYYWEFTSQDGLGEVASQLTHVRSMNDDLSRHGNEGYEVVSIVAFQGAPSGRDPFRKLNHIVVILKRPAK